MDFTSNKVKPQSHLQFLFLQMRIIGNNVGKHRLVNKAAGQKLNFETWCSTEHFNTCTL